MSIQIDGREAIVEADCGAWVRVYYPEDDREGLVRAADLEASQ